MASEKLLLRVVEGLVLENQSLYRLCEHCEPMSSMWTLSLCCICEHCEPMLYMWALWAYVVYVNTVNLCCICEHCEQCCICEQCVPMLYMWTLWADVIYVSTVSLCYICEHCEPTLCVWTLLPYVIYVNTVSLEFTFTKTGWNLCRNQHTARDRIRVETETCAYSGLYVSACDWAASTNSLTLCNAREAGIFNFYFF